MSFLDEIYEAYLAIDGWISSQEIQAESALKATWARTGELNEYAFFVLFFGQIEDYIDQEYEETRGDPTRAAFRFKLDQVKCLWQKDESEEQWIIDIEDRSAAQLIAEKEGKSIKELIEDYYDIRCEIAHGRVESGHMGNRIQLPTIYLFIQSLITA